MSRGASGVALTGATADPARAAVAVNATLGELKALAADAAVRGVSGVDAELQSFNRELRQAQELAGRIFADPANAGRAINNQALSALVTAEQSIQTRITAIRAGEEAKRRDDATARQRYEIELERARAQVADDPAGVAAAEGRLRRLDALQRALSMGYSGDAAEGVAEQFAAGEEAANRVRDAIAKIDFANIESFAIGQNRAARAVASFGIGASNAAEKTAANTAATAKAVTKLVDKLAVGNG